MLSRRFIVVTIVAWSAVALGATADSYMYATRGGHEVSFFSVLTVQVPGWVVWALATPGIVWLSKRFPMWPLRARGLAVHAAGWFAVSVAFVITNMIAERAATWAPVPNTLPIVTRTWHGVISWSPSLIMAYAGIVGAGHALGYAAQVQREQSEKAQLATQLVEAQLGALRMQLQPHFLFNTLNSIAMLVRSADNDRAVEMIALLGEVLRTLLRGSSELEASLGTDFALLRRYLAIEQIRFADRLRVTWRIDPDVECAQVPPLILQPIVENALRHGLWPRAEGGELVIAARRIGDDLELEVADDGIGLSSEFSLDHTRGVGLVNTRTRLDRMYGEAATFEVARRAPRGVSVRLRMPFSTEPREPSNG